MKFLHDLDRLNANVAKELLFNIETEVAEGVQLFWSRASDLLHGSGVSLMDVPAESLSLKRNFFSGLFLYTYVLAGIPRNRRVTYAAINHCLRAMVTGCDNLLDDEYKPTLLTDLPADGTRFRSVLDIMAADRVIFNILLSDLNTTSPQAISAAKASLMGLIRSGAQEASEEAGIGEQPLRPSKILSEVHHFKTGILFQSPWSIPSIFESTPKTVSLKLQSALYRIGMGCQILDDLVNVQSDIEKRRHNYVVSLAWHGDSCKEHQLIAQACSKPQHKKLSVASEIPLAASRASTTAMDMLQKGLETLFTGQNAFLVPIVANYLAKLIRADEIISDIPPNISLQPLNIEIPTKRCQCSL